MLKPLCELPESERDALAQVVAELAEITGALKRLTERAYRAFSAYELDKRTYATWISLRSATNLVAYRAETLRTLWPARQASSPKP